jgi:uncharacterized alpha-E superfamily protein
MLSRVASSIYWMARYVERAENLARFIEVASSVSLDQPDSGVEQWEPLVRATGDEEYFEDVFGDFSSDNVKAFLTFDAEYHSSILTAVNCARENARTVREAISSEAWEQLNTLYHFVREASLMKRTQEPAFYDDIVQHCYMFTGILNSTMTRDTGWHFANVGQSLERADKISRILDVKYFTLLRAVSDVDTPVDDLLWSAVLRSTCAFEMFRKEFHAITVPRIVNFLILNQRFPRAIRHCIEETRASLLQISGPVSELQNESLQKAELLIAELCSTDAETIINSGMHEFIDAIQMSLNAISTAIDDTYFAQRPFPTVQQQQQ